MLHLRLRICVEFFLALLAITATAQGQLAITTPSPLPDGMVGAVYSQTLTATGGAGGNVWSISDGALPQGLNLSAAGAINGTPLAPSTENFTARVRDGANRTSTKAFAITIDPAPLNVTTTSLPNGVAGAGYSQTLSASGGAGGNAWSISAGSLPQGLNLSAAGTISGTPSAASTANFTAQVKDSANKTATKGFTLAINPALSIATGSLPNGLVGTAYSQTLSASGGTGGNSWSVAGGTLPQGLSINAGGTINGTPGIAIVNNLFTVLVRDSSGAAATKALTITVDQQSLTVTTTSLPNGVVGTAYSQSLSASGGTGGNTWSVVAGSLPPQLTLSPAGAIAGTPNAAVTNAAFTVQVKDSSGATATKALTITINPQTLTITTTSLPNGAVGTAYSQTLTASGGTGGNAWSVAGGTLPQGLSINAGGTISGTPGTAILNELFTVLVRDSSGAAATKALTITIDTQSLTVTTASLPNGAVGTAYSQTLSASGGAGGNTWSVVAGTLPQGLTLGGGGAISGTPSAAITNAAFTVQVKDSSGATATKALTITISAGLSVTTSSLPNGTVGTAYAQSLTATGGSGGYTWSVVGGSLPQGLSLSPAGAISGTPTTIAASVAFTAQVKDSSGALATKALTITINSPTLSVTTSALPGGTAGAAYSQPLAASGGAGGYTWSVASGSLPQGLNLDAGGTISGTPTTVAASVAFTVQVKDSSGATATKPLTITISAAALTVTTSTLPGGTVGSAYSQPVTASGGTGGYTWSVASGSLPQGLALDTAGAISGTPATPAANAGFTIQVKDSSGATATKSVTLTINAAPLSVSTTSLPNATLGGPYSQTLTANGGTGGYKWSLTAGSLPAGLALDAPTGKISGTPTSASAGGTSSFTVQVADSAGATATRNLTLTVLSAITVSTAPDLPPATAGVAYSASISVAGGAPPYTVAVVSGQLPPGLTLNASSGAISGTPAVAGTFNITIQVTDDQRSTPFSGAFTLIVRAALAIKTAPALANGAAGTGYSQIMAATGGVPPYTWSLASGTLPNGLTLNSSTGEIGGTPSQTGTFVLTLQVKDASSGVAQGRFTLLVFGGLTIVNPPVLPGATIAVPYRLPLQAVGGTAPYTWAATAGALPAGVSFNSNGQIDGTPSASGSFAFTVQLTDANSNRASKDFTLSVAASLALTTAPALPDGATGAPYTVTLAGTGGTPPYSLSVTAGTLPPGLTLEAPTGSLSGTPTTAGNFSFTVTLTDSASVTSQKPFTIAIGQGLTFATPASLPDATAGAPYSFTLQATGGLPPYSWRVSSGSLPTGLALNGSSGIVGGTPSADGTFNLTVEVADSARLTAARVHTIVVGLPPLPTLSITGPPDNLGALQQPLLDITLSDPYPVPITGRLNVAFIPANGNPDDPAVQFSTGGRSAAFTIPANATHATFPGAQLALQSGSVTGSIKFTVESLQAGSTALPPPDSAARTVQVDPAAPAIRGITVVHNAGGFEVQIVGVSTTRELTRATVRFHASAAGNLQTSQVTVALADAGKSWFQNATSAAFGGQFTLTLPFTFVGAANVLDSVSVVLSNSVGDSTEASGSY